MGTKVQNLPGYYSMRDLNEESSSCGWPLFYGDKTMTNGQYYNDYQPSASADGCSTYDKDVVKRMMLEHEAIFKKQVCELHRLYRIQKNLMAEVKRKELHRNHMPAETSFSTGPLASQITSEDGQKCHISGFPMANSACARPSISGVEGVHSPLGSAKENSKQVGLFPFPNGSSSRDVGMLESRPSNVRRKMFDLHLPADQYIDTEESEKVSDKKINGIAVYLPDGNCIHGKENDVKLFCGNGGKAGSHEESSRCDRSLRGGNGLADLNEPVQVEETNASAYGHLSHYSCQGANECSGLSAKEKSQFFNFSGDGSFNSHRGSDSRAQNNEHLENNASRRGWIPSVLESGQAKSNLKPIPQALKQEKLLLSSQIMQEALSKAHESPSDYLTNLSKTDLWSEKTVRDLEVSERSHEMSINKHPEPVVSSHRSSLSAVAPSSNLVKSWPHSASSWEMASSSLSQKLMPVQIPPCVNASGTLSLSSLSGQSNGILGDSWPVSTNSRSNSSFQCDIPIQNGFYHGSSSGSKDLSVNISSISYDYLNHNNDRKRNSEHFMNHGSAKYCKSSNCNDMKSGKDVNFNALLSNGLSNNFVSQSGFGIMGGEHKHEEHLAVLPWLRPKMAFKNEAHSAGRDLIAGESSISEAASLFNKDKTGKGTSGNFLLSVTSVSCSNDIEPRRTEVGDSSNIKKILGVPIFDVHHISPKESSSLTSPSVSIPGPSDIETVENKQKKHALDINLPCDAAVLELDKQAVTVTIASRKGSPTIEANSRNQIDLNLSMSEDEASLTPISTIHVKMKPEIDLEAPAVPEMEEDVIFEEKQPEPSPESPKGSQDKVEQPQDELLKCAAEAIVAMSSLFCNQVDDVISCPSESPMVDLLSWFADVVFDMSCDMSRGIDVEHNNEQSVSEGMDYFESMTLQLTETKEEDYMPKPLVPENFKVEESGTTSLPTRTRKGPARRGRQQRDFQRDILPGIASLSRHEVTEDLQTFGGLMRATGHPWHSGLTRRSSSRNGCGRRRRRLQVTPSPAPSPPPPPLVANNETSAPPTQQLNNIAVGLEDRSLTGWGKTTRRPRRQRFPAGNPPPIPLT